MFKYCSSVHPCQVCGNTKKGCRTAPSGLVGCRGCDEYNHPAAWKYLKIDVHGFNWFAPANGSPRPTPSPLHQSPTAGADMGKALRDRRKAIYAKRKANEAARVREDRRKLDAEESYNLALHLSLPESALWSYPLHIIDHDRYGRCFTYDTLNADGTPAGLKYRIVRDDGEGDDKLSCMSPGLIYDEKRLTADDTSPILHVEGLTDVLAAHAIGLPAIGRDNNRHGATVTADLIERLGIDPKRLIIVGENDRKEDGRHPGREGAVHVASQLASRFGEPIRASFPPPQYKDVRDWMGDLWWQHEPQEPSWPVVGRPFELRPEWGCTREVSEYLAVHAELIAATPPDAADTGPRGADPYADLETGACEHDPNPPQPYTPAPYQCGCPNSTPVPLRSRNNKKRLAWVDGSCGRTDCRVCGPLRQQHWLDSLKRRLREWQDLGNVAVYLFECRPNQAHSLNEYMRKNGRFIRLSLDAMNRVCQCVASREPPASFANVRRVLIEDAISELSVAIKYAPMNQLVGRKVWNSSRNTKCDKKRGWVLIDDGTEPTGEWEIAHEANCTCLEAERIAKAYPLVAFNLRGPYGLYRPRTLFVVETPTARMREHILFCLRCGENMPDVDVRFPRSQAHQQTPEPCTTGP
jgi:hypothetical protein